MTKLAEYIKQELKNGRREFNIGLNRDMTVDNNSPTRVQFKVKQKRKGKESKYQEEHRCKNSNHPTTHVKMNMSCPKSWKCLDYHGEGCIAK